MTIVITSPVWAFISKLVALQPPPVSIWLIGSRANGRATHQSDTDLLVFGSENLIVSAKSQLRQPDDVDCLIVFNDDEYQDPWQNKSGSLRQLQWEQIDSNSAEYIGTKWLPDRESLMERGSDLGDIIYLNEKAIKLWPKN